MLKGINNSLKFLLSRINVPAIKKSKPIISTSLSDSPKRIKANNATKPGVNASKGNALLISRFFSETITQ